MHLIESKIPFQEFVVMMQREVADRISAEPNTKAYGSLSIAVQYYMTAKVAFIVPRTVFVPAPNVDSAILKMVRRDQPLIEVKDEDFFSECLALVLSIVARPCGITWLAILGSLKTSRLNLKRSGTSRYQAFYSWWGLVDSRFWQISWCFKRSWIIKAFPGDNKKIPL